MKRDLELVKMLLEHIENNHDGQNHMGVNSIHIDTYSPEQIMYHVKLLANAELILFKDVHARNPGFLAPAEILGITWKGHEFLSCSKNSRIWKAMTKVADPLSVRAAVILMEKLAANQAFWFAFWHYIAIGISAIIACIAGLIKYLQ